MLSRYKSISIRHLYAPLCGLLLLSNISALEVRSLGNSCVVDTGAMRFEFDTAFGILKRQDVGGKKLVSNGEKPLLFASLLPSEEFDGIRDAVAGDIINATLNCEASCGQPSRPSRPFCPFPVNLVLHAPPKEEISSTSLTIEGQAIFPSRKQRKSVTDAARVAPRPPGSCVLAMASCLMRRAVSCWRALFKAAASLHALHNLDTAMGRRGDVIWCERVTDAARVAPRHPLPALHAGFSPFPINHSPLTIPH